MPAADPVDQHAAREYEQTLRYYVYSGRTPQSRLDWFEALPKRVRRSRRLIDEALGPIEAAETRAREALAEQLARELEKSLRLATARAQPRDLSCLKVDGKTWNGLGRRKRRCRAFASVGRAYNIRQRVADTAQSTGNPAFDTFLLHPSSCHVPKRPPTPLGLRETIWNVPGLVYVAQGPANAADYGFPTPLTPLSVALESPVASVVPPPDFPHSPQPHEFSVDGNEIDPDFSYVVAQGRYSRAPEPDYSAQRAAFDVHAAEEQFPGALGYLANLLFPAGVSQYGEMVDARGMDALLDFVYGWYDLSRRARECGHFG
ncbi:hypothetical protein RhiJN_10800 [Ceratobasidium sp. AG-Ba]|nr:hypothetical protein RhiJN_10800 [Ceratobasidium sp. AG-Ba]